MATGGGRDGDANTSGWGRYVRAATQYYGTTSSQTDSALLGQGTRRRKLLQVASNYYLGSTNRSAALHEMGTINNDHQLWLFPSYAREVPRRSMARDNLDDGMASHDRDNNGNDSGTVCQVDVRGWMFTPHAGVHGRKTRWQIGLLRWLCGLSNQVHVHSVGGNGGSSDEEADAITSAFDRSERSQFLVDATLDDGNGASTLAGRFAWLPGPSQTPPSAMTAAELQAANDAFEQRIGPFTHTPVKNQPVTVFFYDLNNDTQAQSRTLYTSENGHFTCRADLSFIPTHLRVMASETLSATQEIEIRRYNGVSIVSDIDDTVKNSGIMLGAREMAKATFTAPMKDFIIEGVAEWYQTLAGPPYDCSLHYISNSPWQLYPVLRSFFSEIGLPVGSFDLKHYHGMLQGILEPAAERKRGTIERVMQDFPHRKWLFIGDSGEADLEIYTEMAERWPDKVLAVCIRDITTKGYPPFNLSELTMYGTCSEELSLQENSMRRDPRMSYAIDKQAPIHLPQPVSQSSFSNNVSTNPPARPRMPRGLRGPPVPPKPASLRQTVESMYDDLNRTFPESQPPRLPCRNKTSKCDCHQSASLSRPPPGMVAPVPMVNNCRKAEPPSLLLKDASTSMTIDMAAYVPPFTKQELAWMRRWQVAKEKLELRNVKLLSWRVGTDLKEVTTVIVERELRKQQWREATWSRTWTQILQVCTLCVLFH